MASYLCAFRVASDSYLCSHGFFPISSISEFLKEGRNAIMGFFFVIETSHNRVERLRGSAQTYWNTAWGRFFAPADMTFSFSLWTGRLIGTLGPL